MILEGKHGKYEVVMGLEVHVQMDTSTKLFSRARNRFADAQNSNVLLFDIAVPGQLPKVNKEAVNKTIAAGLAINAKINQYSVFDRKHYFYADLPQGYQITQFYHPIVQDGFIDVTLSDQSTKKIRINRIHIEQDAGKSIHDLSNTETFLDYNRAGVPLMEIVSEPDFRSVDEVVCYLKELRSILRFINASTCDMEKGTLRCDVNVSIMPIGSNVFGTRCEIKNLNSFKFIADAIQYEANRQMNLIESGQEVSQETRLFNTTTGETKTMRTKEDALDYRYFPDPDLLPVIITKEDIQSVQDSIKELPAQKKSRYKESGLSNKEIDTLFSDFYLMRVFDQINAVHDAKTCSTWLLTEFLGKINKLSIAPSDSKVSAPMFIELIDLIKSSKINGKIAKDVLDDMLATGDSASSIVEAKNLTQIDNDDLIKDAIFKVINDNPELIAKYKGGDMKIVGFFVGQVMKVTSGKANPQKVNQLLSEILETLTSK